jgi:uncharacterized protein (TIGR03118 family)
MVVAGLLACAVASSASRAAQSVNDGYEQVNLVSDIASMAKHTDPALVNPWGIVVGPEVVWVNNAGTGLTKAYGRNGRAHRFAIHVPAPGGGDEPGEPTGLVVNHSGQFVITNGRRRAPSTFLMSTENGTITAWNHSVTGSNAVIVVDRSASDANYKGLAIARDTNGAPNIYAANFRAGVVDVFDGQFQHRGSFTDSSVPPMFAPFNVQNIRGKLFVTFAKLAADMEDDEPGPGNGFVDIFDTDGTLLRRFASAGALNSPWGLAVAPQNFGQFSHALLVGNFGDGRINAYDLLTGKLLGHLTRPNGEDIEIEGLWGLSFERQERFEHDCDFEAKRLYFAAGIEDEAHGLLGFIRLADRDHDDDDDDDHDDD